MCFAICSALLAPLSSACPSDTNFLFLANCFRLSEGLANADLAR